MCGYFDMRRNSGHLEKPFPFMPFDFAQESLRQAQHERKRLILKAPFALSLSKGGVFRGALGVGLFEPPSTRR